MCWVVYSRCELGKEKVEKIFYVEIENESSFVTAVAEFYLRKVTRKKEHFRILL